MVLLINDKESYERWKSFVEQFEKELYLPSFPNEDEREPFQNIVSRVVNSTYPLTTIQLIVDGGRVDAGLVSDYYPECNSIEPIYLVVREELRKHGLGRALIESAMYLYPNVKHMFLEVDNPMKVSEGDSIMDPKTRINIYEHLGLRVIPFDYVQPPLKDGGNYEDGLLLMHKGESLTAADLKLFLFHFYRGLRYEGSDVLQKMFDEIDDKWRRG